MEAVKERLKTSGRRPGDFNMLSPGGFHIGDFVGVLISRRLLKELKVASVRGREFGMRLGI